MTLSPLAAVTFSRDVVMSPVTLPIYQAVRPSLPFTSVYVRV